MKSAICSIVGVALLATCMGAPVAPNVGIDLLKDDILAWSEEFTIGGQQLLVGLEWQTDGTISAGTRLNTNINGQEVPLTVAISSNTKDMKQVTYQLGTKVGDYAGSVVGDSNGELAYTLNALTTLNNNVKIGASLEGDLTQPASLTAALDLGKEVIQARVDFDDDLAPKNFNVQVGANQ